MLKKTIFFILFISLLAINSHLFAYNTLETKAINTPKTSLYNVKQYAFEYKLYRNGGVIFGICFGALSSFNLGITLDISNMISEKRINPRLPKFNVKIGLYKGNTTMPAISLGYDGQGYGDYNNKRYEEKERGLYLVASREFFFPSLLFNFGVNLPNLENSQFYPFINATYSLNKNYLLVAELDNIYNALKNRLNVGIKYSITNNFNIMLVFKKINAYKDEIERTFELNYITNF